MIPCEVLVGPGLGTKNSIFKSAHISEFQGSIIIFWQISPALQQVSMITKARMKAMGLDFTLYILPQQSFDF